MREFEQLLEDLKEEGLALLEYDDQAIHSFPHHSPWIEDLYFSQLYAAISNNALVDRTHFCSLSLVAQQALTVGGDLLEVGTWRSGTAGLLASAAPDRTVFVANAFRGVVKSADWEHYRDSAHSDTDEERVESFLAGLGLSKIEPLVGLFPEETGSRLASRDLCLVFLDVDVYWSARDAFEFVWDLVVPGGVVVLDDYGFMSACGGIKQFVNEVWDDPDKLIITNLNGHACIVRR